MRMIHRNYSYTINDDYKLHVEPKLDRFTESLEVKVGEKTVGWRIRSRYQ